MCIFHEHTVGFVYLECCLGAAAFSTMTTPANSNESYCTFTLALDVTAGGLPSEEEIAKDLENHDPNVSSPPYMWHPYGILRKVPTMTAV